MRDRKHVFNDLCQAVAIRPEEGIQLLHAGHLNHDTIQTGQHVIVWYRPKAALSNGLKDTLLTKYPVDHHVALIDATEGSDITEEAVSWFPLNTLKRLDDLDYDWALYLPPLALDEQVTSLSTLQYYIDRVTGPGGDVWIQEQTPQSLVTYVKEETQELIEAIEKKDTDNWKEELGDVLVQILYQTNRAEKEGHFTFEDVLEEVNLKIRRRHPHVFDGVKAETPEEVDALWQKIKLEEKRRKNETR